METKSRSNLSNMKQKELSKLSNDETIVIKPADKRRAVVILSTSHNQSMIIQHLLDENTNTNWILALITEYRVTFSDF